MIPCRRRENVSARALLIDFSIRCKISRMKSFSQIISYFTYAKITLITNHFFSGCALVPSDDSASRDMRRSSSAGVADVDGWSLMIGI